MKGWCYDTGVSLKGAKWKQPVRTDHTLYGFYVVWLCLYVMPRMGEYTETESRLVAGKGWKKRKQEVTANGFGVSFQSDGMF